MIQLSKEQLTKLREVQVEMLLEVKRICKKHDIKYCMIGGTMLGAIRHKGYIPWDDDADVAMLREDYEKFRVICEQELDANKYYFQDDRNTEGYRWGYGKLRKKNTLFMRENQRHLNFGQEIFIDIFPLDYTPDHMLGRIWHMFHCYCVRKLLWSPVGMIVNKSKVKRMIYTITNKIPKKVIYEHYYKYINSRKKSNSVRLNLFPTRKPYGFPIHFFEELMEFEFEGQMLMGTKHYHEYLTMKFDDYMKLPPKEHQKIHPVEEIRFE